MKRIVWISWLLLLGACNRADELRFEEHFDPERAETVDIAYLKSLCRGDNSPIRRTLVIEGRVTGNDLFREFPRQLRVEDPSGGIAIQIDGFRLHERYPTGAPLRIFCEGLWLGDYGGTVLLGAEPTGTFAVDRIPSADFAFRVQVLAEDFEPVAPADCTLGDLSPALLGRFIRLSEVEFVAEEQGACWCETDPLTNRTVATTRHLHDAEGSTLSVYTAAECLYAKEPLPSGKGSVCGILDRFNGEMQLRISNRDFLFAE